MGNLPSLVHTAKPQHPNSPRDVKTRRCLPFPGNFQVHEPRNQCERLWNDFDFLPPMVFQTGKSSSLQEPFFYSAGCRGSHWLLKHVKFIPNMAPLPSSAVGPSCLPGSKSSETPRRVFLGYAWKVWWITLGPQIWIQSFGPSIIQVVQIYQHSVWVQSFTCFAHRTKMYTYMKSMWHSLYHNVSKLEGYLCSSIRFHV